MKPKFLIVFLKELRESLRDKRSLGLIAMFTLMYPIMIGFILHKQIERATRTERESIELAVIGGAQAPTLMGQLKQKNITVRETAPMDEKAIGDLLRSRKVAALLRLSDKFGESYDEMRPARVELWYDSAAESMSRKREIEDVLDAYRSSVAGARLLAHGVSPTVMMPIQVQRYDTATNASRFDLIGGMLGILFIPAFICGLSAAIDSTAGERERRSMEVLMAQPASAWELVSGKWLAAATLAVVAVTLELMVMHVIFSWLPLEEIGMSWRMSWINLLMICLTAVPLSMFATALQVAVAMNARSFKEAQTILNFLILLPMLPGLLVGMLELKTAFWMYFVPMLSNNTLLREIAKGSEVGALPFVLTFLSSALPALIAIGVASWRMKSERYVLAV